MPEEIEETEKPEKKEKIQKPEVILTVEEAKKQFFPKDFIASAPVKFVSDQNNVVVKVSTRMIFLPHLVLVRDYRGNVNKMTSINVGGYNITFEGKTFETSNLLEVEACDKAGHVIREESFTQANQTEKVESDAVNPY